MIFKLKLFPDTSDFPVFLAASFASIFKFLKNYLETCVNEYPKDNCDT